MNRPIIAQYTIMLLLALATLLVTGEASAFPATTYTESSRLADGRWMKVSVDADGVYLISTSTLRSWGFSDPSKVHVYGYGGRRLPDILDADTYLDDLPQVQSVVTDRGIIFYGLGAGEWTTSTLSHIYFRQNDYSSRGHYFIGEAPEGEARLSPGSTATALDAGATAATTFSERCHHELERTAVPGEAGPELLGEDMRYTTSRTISFDAPGAEADKPVSFLCSFVSAMTGGTGSLSFTLNGSPLPAVNNDRVSATNSSSYIHANETLTSHSATASPSSKGTYELGITFKAGGSCTGAWLNYVTLVYSRKLALPSSGYLLFNSTASALKLSGTSAGLTVWDVTDPRAVAACATTAPESGTAAWSNSGAASNRTFVAWSSNATLPVPRAEGFVAAQNLHADRDYDMVIVSPQAFIEQAERLAALHRDSSDSLRVKVVRPEVIYNEFSSGTTDAGAFRRYFKMLRDRGLEEGGRPLRYAIMMGRTSLDNRGLCATTSSIPTVPMWMTRGVRASLSDNDGYCTDDITAMLDDGSGASFGTDRLSIAIGRIPILSAAEAKDVVDKAHQYAESAKKSAWKHRYMFLADDQDNGIHLRQSESLIAQFETSDRQQHLVRKVYMDAYPFVGSNYPEARAAMFRYLDEGVVWWSFIGHANTTGWTQEQQITYSDLNSLYLRNWPFIYAATCNFLRIDGNFISGGEILYKERYGGAIGMISATRPVYITENGNLSDAIGRALSRRDDSGRLLTPGEIYRQSKNDIRNSDGSISNSTNRLRYVFIGDPALRLAMPSNIVRVDSINGEPFDAGNQPTMAAYGQVPLAGSVTAPDGKVLDGFNGVVLIEIFDAERSRTTLGHGETGSIETFQDYGERIYCGSAEVKNGRFSINVSMPSETTQNFTPATMSLYAYSTVDDTEAVGLNRDFYVYGYDESAKPDDKAPVIEQFVLNHSNFRSGGTVNDSPMIIATVRDDVGINVSNAGVGHQMTAILDRTTTFTDVSYYYTPSADGSPSGVINYPLDGLQPGNHTLALRIWDTAGNSGTAEIDFFVQENLAPKIYEVYTDANPASTQANFYLSHDQPDNMVTVEISVYNLIGRKVWSGEATGRSDMFTSVPVTWDLTDMAGRRVGRGIYLYRASITSDGSTYETASRRIAVTAQ
ncbi:MAG: type IX secretion system sortase PorU [Muribaculaceae bacterium]|nr:type IX secretion system sortase PorU [Muribaculaceae bacterium]